MAELPSATRTALLIAAVNDGPRATEEYLRERRLPSVLLRNGWYLENYTAQLPLFLQNGAVIGAVGQGRVSAASRADYAEAAAVTLTTEGHAGAVYELGGDEAFTLAELAAAISAAAGAGQLHRPAGGQARPGADRGWPAGRVGRCPRRRRPRPEPWRDVHRYRGPAPPARTAGHDPGRRGPPTHFADTGFGWTRGGQLGGLDTEMKGHLMYIGIGTVVVIVIIVLVVLALRR